MKIAGILSLSAVTISLVSCGGFKSFKQPLRGGDFDPLSSPGASRTRSAVPKTPSPTFKSGQWVETSMANATFFRAIPKGAARADKVLAAGVPMKVVSSRGTYVKVELDSGDVGFVPSIMVSERGNPGVSTSGPGNATDFGPVPPPIDPSLSAPDLGPPPEVPDAPVPVPSVPSLPVPDLPPAPSVPAVPGPPPTVPGVGSIPPPPDVPGVTIPGGAR